MAICPGDKAFVLRLLDFTIDEVYVPHGLRLIRTLMRFGQKDPSSLSVDDLICHDEVSCISVHAATSILCRSGPRPVHLMWSRYGIEQVTGRNGCVYTNMSIHEAANYQSPLDHHGIDVSPLISDVVSKVPEEPLINHIQLYCDSPHTHQSPFYKHPVTGVVATCGLLHPSKNTAMVRRAQAYMHHFEDLKDKARIHVPARVEFVLCFESSRGIPACLDPGLLLDRQGLQRLLGKEDMLVPFMDADGKGLHDVCQAVLTHLCKVLRENYTSNVHRGGYDSSWKVFQAELALEEYFHGQPRCPESRQYSVSLGTSSCNINSCTKARGFIGLAPHSSASAGLSPPPLRHFCWDTTQVERVERLFLFSDSLQASVSVIGQELVKVLIKDVYRSNVLQPLESLKNKNKPPIVLDSRDYAAFSVDIASHISHFRFPCVLQRAHSLVTDMGFTFADVLESGLSCMDLKWFPFVRFYEGRSKRANWDYKTYIELYPTGGSRVMPVTLSLANDIIGHIVERRLAHDSKMDRYREWGMPWLKEVVRRIPERHRNPDNPKDADKRLKLLVFISCVAMIQNGSYVDFNCLTELYQSIPYTIKMLRDVRIFGNFTMPHVLKGTVQLYKLAEGIDFKIGPERPPRPPPRKEKVVEDDEVEPMETDDVQRLNDADDDVKPESSTSMMLPAKTYRLWEARELALIPLTHTRAAAYRVYLKACQEANIKARSFFAFELKRRALIKAQKKE